ncbi:MAG: peptidoglycan DD-metalloendopeptidase family protein [Candidatus Uhrbacteria bacterium]
MRTSRIATLSGVTIAIVLALATGAGVLAVEKAAGVKQVFELNKQIDVSQDRLDELNAQIERYRNSLRAEQGKAATFQQRLRVLNDRVAKQRLEIERVQTEQSQVSLEIEATQISLETARDAVTKRHALLAALLTEMRAADTQPQLHIILASDSIGAYYSHLSQLSQLQQHMRSVLAEVQGERQTLEVTESQLSTKQHELQTLQEQLVAEHESLEEEQQTKARLLAATQSNEQRYQTLVSELRAEVQGIDNEIVSLEARVREQLAAIDESFGRDGRIAFSWPVPNRGITAYFHDPDYPYRYLFEHPAIDIRAAQGSTITAPAPGYVAKTKDNGYGYSYVMLVHPGGFSTVYGHVSCFKVGEGEYVSRGDAIACVGGRPGTRGAGSYSSGAHLHFEIRLNGIPVNPLNYLL